jgi:hypothetical protein
LGCFIFHFPLELIPLPDVTTKNGGKMSINELFSDLNIWAILVAGIVHMVIGLIWFQPGIFGNTWVKLTGGSLNPAVRWVPAGALGHLVMSLILAVIIKLAGATTFLNGALIGILICIAFVATLEVGELIWEKIPFKLFLLRVGNQLIGFIVSGGILAIWR